MTLRLNSNPHQESASSQIRQNRRRQLLLWTPQKTLHLVHSYTTFCSPNPRSESESPRRPGCYGLRISRTRKRPLRVRTRSLKPRRVTWSRAPTVASQRPAGAGCAGLDSVSLRVRGRSGRHGQGAGAGPGAGPGTAARPGGTRRAEPGLNLAGRAGPTRREPSDRAMP